MHHPCVKNMPTHLQFAHLCPPKEGLKAFKRQKKQTTQSTLPNSQDSCLPSGSKRRKKSAINITSYNRQGCNQGHLLDMNCPLSYPKAPFFFSNQTEQNTSDSSQRISMLQVFVKNEWTGAREWLGGQSVYCTRVQTWAQISIQKKTDMVAFSYNLSARWEKGSGDYQKLVGQMV